MPDLVAAHPLAALLTLALVVACATALLLARICREQSARIVELIDAYDRQEAVHRELLAEHELLLEDQRRLLKRIEPRLFSRN